MDHDDEHDDLFDEEAQSLFLSPEDRLWRHPSELRDNPLRASLPALTANGGTVTTPPQPRTWAVAVVAGLVGALIASAVSFAAGDFDARTTIINPVAKIMSNDTLASAGGANGGLNWPDVVEKISSSVVAIQVSGPAGTTVGSGVLFESGNGNDLAYILTDAALLAGGGTLSVVFSDGTEDTARLVGADNMSGIGLVSVPGDQRLFPPLGSVANVREAEPLMSVGAITTAGPSAIPGTVSSLDAAVSSTSGATMTNLIAVSNAPLPTVNAGGPFVDPTGVVIGISAPIDPTNAAQQGLSFAIPIDVAVHVAQALIAQSKPTHPWVGVANGTDLPNSTAQNLGISGGVEVDTVVSGSPASQAGLVPSDVISSLGGQQVTSTGGLVKLLYSGTLGARVPITYYHQGKQVSTMISVVDQPANLQIGG